ncbi:MAG TPA: tetratricopeptide repeat protein [Longimicrobium sp.]|nr:tetratricopeptide repeat protein [Longimicrobium sp.]
MPLFAEAVADPADLAHAAEQEQLGHWPAAARLYSRAFRSATLAGRVEEAADALRGQARVLIREERYEEAEELATLSMEIAQRANARQSAARAVNVLGIIRHSQRDWAGSRELFRRAVELALDLGDDELVGLACQNAGVIAYGLGDLREARAAYLESIGSFVRSGSSENALHAYNNLGIASAELREWLEADVFFSRGIEIAERLSHTPLLAKLYGNRAEPLIEIGDLDAAEATLEGAERAAMAVGDRVALGVALRWRSKLARVRGDFVLAEDCVQRALVYASDPTLERAEIILELGDLRAHQGRAADAEAAYLDSRELSSSLAADLQVRELDARISALHQHSVSAAPPPA